MDIKNSNKIPLNSNSYNFGWSTYHYIKIYNY